MKDTRATQISATVFHKQKYITNPDITPKDRVISSEGKSADALKGCMPPHRSDTTLKQLERIRTIPKKGRIQTVHQNPPGNPPTTPPPPRHNHPAHVQVQVSPNPTPLETPLISSTVTPPRVVPPPRVEPPTVVLPPRVVPPPKAVHPEIPRRSPCLEAQHIKL